MTNPMRLILLRHAKSSWNDLGVKDHQRPLNARGQRDAPRIGARLAELGWSPDHVVSSDSRRTRETWSLLAPAFGAEAPTPQWLSALYLGDLDAILDALGEAPAESRCVLALGHNPGWEDAVSELSGTPTRMTTANAALLERPAVPWTEAGSGSAAWTLVDVLRPKEL